jgi:maltooligosyltrehalose trehalohydrolase
MSSAGPARRRGDPIGLDVWAPRAQRVELALRHPDGREERRDLRPVEAGWWDTDVAASDDQRYAYAVHSPDTADPPLLPDPRSVSQPDGVHGWSEVVDPATFAWTDRAGEPGGWRGVPLRGSVLYELHVGTFTPAGTFDAAIDRLGHLVDLGVDIVELMPVASFPGRWGWGYDGVAPFAAHAPYGGPRGFARFVDACHGAGLGVVLDVVHNHLGPSGNHLGSFGPYFSDRHVTNWGDGVNLDGPDSGEVRRFVLDNARWWLEHMHCDGLRLDAVHALVDDSAVHLLEELSARVDQLSAHLGRPLMLIAESDRNDPRLVRSRDAGGFGLDASWADEWHHALHASLSGERSGYYEDFGDLSDLGKALRQAWVYDGTWSTHRRRAHGRSPAGIDGHRFVVSVQNHDQVGNRAAGDRLGASVSDGRLRVAAALLLTSPFTPMLFQGEEWGASTPFAYFTDHDDPALARAVSEGRRREFAHFGWEPQDVPDPQNHATRDSSVLDWDETDDEPHAGLLAWYRELLALRRRLPQLTDGRWERTQVTIDDTATTIHLRRGEVVVHAHLGNGATTVAVPPSSVLLAASDPDIALTGRDLTLPPDSAAITRRPIETKTGPR